MPWSRHAAANAVPPVISGAKLTSFTGVIAAMPSTSRMLGLRTNAGFCAPQHAGLMNGPSRWMPSAFANRMSRR